MKVHKPYFAAFLMKLMRGFETVRIKLISRTDVYKAYVQPCLTGRHIHG